MYCYIFHLWIRCLRIINLPDGALGDNLPVIVGHIRDSGLIPGSGRSPGGGLGNPLQYSCLENPMDREAWWATVYRVTELAMTKAT